MRRVARIALALVLGLALAEGALRLVAWANRGLRARPVDAPASADGGADGATWVCIGDSNTYGVFEDDEDTYPAQLEELLRRHALEPPARIVNLGLPGTNGRQACVVLEDALERYDPALVLAWRGGKARFREEPLEEVLISLNRYFKTPIELGDDGLANLPVTGEFDIRDRDTAVKALTLAFNLESRTEPSRVILNRREPE